jgi:hypothetical protein
MSRVAIKVIRPVAIVVAVSAISACTPPAPPPAPPPPPPPVVERVPYRPLPPNQAAYVMDIPRIGADGVRQTPNVGISADERVWYFRSAWNVAALNCLGAENQPILDAYSNYIKTYARPLKQTNDRIDSVYAKKAGSSRAAIKARESRMTLIYNFFALPAARRDFCRAGLDISNRYLTAGKVDPTTFATTNFPVFEQPFENFFQAYEAYERDSAAWDARYGERYGSSQPGYMAVQRARGAYVPVAGESSPSQLISDGKLAETKVIDPDTGAAIPVAPVDTSRTSVPVVQPIPNDAGQNDTPQG